MASVREQIHAALYTVLQTVTVPGQSLSFSRDAGEEVAETLPHVVLFTGGYSPVDRTSAAKKQVTRPHVAIILEDDPATYAVTLDAIAVAIEQAITASWRSGTLNSLAVDLDVEEMTDPEPLPLPNRDVPVAGVEMSVMIEYWRSEDDPEVLS